MKKKKFNAVLVTSLITLSLVGVGFAAWTIGGITPTDSGNVNVEIGNVENNLVEFTLDQTAGAQDLTIRFDNVEKPTVSGMTNSDSKTEDLTFKFTYNITWESTDKALTDLISKVQITFTEDATLKSLADNNHIDLPYLNNAVEVDLTKDTPVTNSPIGGANSKASNTHVITKETQKYTVVSTFNFGWGSLYNNDNPGKFSGDKNMLITNLENFKSITNGKTPTLKATITGVK